MLPRCYFAEALKLTDETTPAGAALATALYCNRALALLRTSPPEAATAVDDGSAAIACAPGSVKAWFRRACAQQAAGKVKEALRDAQQALSLQQRQQQQQSSPGAGAVTGGASEVENLVAALERQLRLGGGEGSPDSLDSLDIGACSGSQRAHALPVLGGLHGEGALPATVPCQATRSTASAATPAAAISAAAGAALAEQLSGGALTVRQSAEAGRYLAAAQGLVAGRDVLREAPFALALTRAGRQAVRLPEKLCCHGALRECILLKLCLLDLDSI